MSVGIREEAAARVATSGRPRDPRIEKAVLTATRDLLVRDGYADLTLDAVAKRARTTKPAIYRRWRSKAHLVHEAAFPTEEAHSAADGESDGTLAGDLRVMVAAATRMLSTPAARAALPGLVAEFQADPALHASLLERFRAGALGESSDRLLTAAARGEARADLDPARVIASMAGSVLFTLLVDPGADLGPEWVEHTTSLLLKGVVG